MNKQVLLTALVLVMGTSSLAYAGGSAKTVDGWTRSQPAYTAPQTAEATGEYEEAPLQMHNQEELAVDADAARAKHAEYMASHAADMDAHHEELQAKDWGNVDDVEWDEEPRVHPVRAFLQNLKMPSMPRGYYGGGRREARN